VIDGGSQQVQGVGHVLAQIPERVLHRLADQRVRSEVHHGFGLVRAEHGADDRGVRQVALDERRLRVDGRAMPLVQVVQHDDRLAGANQLLDHDAANVARPAGDQDLHESLPNAA